MKCDCGAEMKFFEGISKKNGKPYKMDKCPECGDIKWGKIDQASHVSKEYVTREELVAVVERIVRLEKNQKTNAVSNIVVGQPDSEGRPF